MRAFATLIGIFALLLSSCTLEPKSRIDGRAELNKLKGPNVSSIEGSLGEQVQQATAAGDFKRAAQIYKQLADKAPDKEEYGIGLLDSLRRSGDNENALKVSQTLLKKNPASAPVLEGKGLSLMALGEFTDASKAFEEVMKIDGKRWRTLNGIGILFAMKNMQENALAYYNEALVQSPDNPNVLNNMGLTLAMDRQYEKAFDAFDRGKRHLPSNSPEVRHIDLNKALVYAIAGKLDEAEQTATPHLSKAGLYNNMGFYAYLAKNTDLAKGYLNMALTQSPTYYERAWKNLSAINSGEEQPQDISTKQNRGALPHPSLLNKGTKSAEPVTIPAKKIGVELSEIPEPTAGIKDMSGDKLDDFVQGEPEIRKGPATKDKLPAAAPASGTADKKKDKPKAPSVPSAIKTEQKTENKLLKKKLPEVIPASEEDDFGEEDAPEAAAPKKPPVLLPSQVLSVPTHKKPVNVAPDKDSTKKDDAKKPDASGDAVYKPKSDAN